MSVITPTVSKSPNGDIVTITYANMKNGDVGSPIDWVQWADRSVQVSDAGALAFGVGGNMQWQGSNDSGTTWSVLTDPQGGSLDFVASKIEQVSEMTQLARPEITAGDVNTDLNVIVCLRRAQPARV